MTGGFPFSAVVGHDDVKLALLLNAVDPGVGGVLLRGQKGSAKSTLARALAALLGDDVPFVELPVGATEDRLIGSIDVAAALGGGGVRFRAGLLAAADGGVLYVDEVNLLADHLVDALLDVAASGVNRVEREGISHEHASRFLLIGSMNPEEGDLRPQLLDRFGLAVDIVSSSDPDERAEAVARRLAFDRDPEAFAAGWRAQDNALVARVRRTRPAAVSGELLRRVSVMCAAVGAEGLRADLTVARASAVLAGWLGRPEATIDDVRRVAPLALGHRRRRSPFEEPGVSAEELNAALDGEGHAGAGGAGDPDRDGGDPGDPDPGGGGSGGAEDLGGSGGSGGAGDRRRDGGGVSQADAGSLPPGTGDRPPPGPHSTGQHSAGPPPGSPGGDRTAAPGAPTRVVRLEAGRAPDGADGRRSAGGSQRGRVVGDRAPSGDGSAIAVAATARAAARRHGGAPAGGVPPHGGSSPDGGPAATTGTIPSPGGGVSIEPGDLREAVREARVGNLLILAVDASGSMGARRRMEAAKGAVVSLLLDAYQRRDRVALLTFRGEGAEVVLGPTASVEVARARLASLPTGGRTPLAAGLTAALALAVAGGRAQQHRPLIVLVSDGRATAAPGGADPLVAAREAAAAVRRRAVASVVVDAEEGPTRLGLARELAAVMGARHLSLPELSAGSLDGALRHLTAV